MDAPMVRRACDLRVGYYIYGTGPDGLGAGVCRWTGSDFEQATLEEWVSNGMLFFSWADGMRLREATLQEAKQFMFRQRGDLQKLFGS